MSEVITIDNIEYVGYEENEPNSYELKIDNKYNKILKEDYCYIQKGSHMLYKVDENNVKSGILIKFIAPSIFVLKNTRYMYIWSIDIEESEIYIKDTSIIKKENRIKDELFKLYNKGYIKILDEPMTE
jgi:hypothetical protein|tara:strand:+ start:240 stop:623 length:384 start_codon:yes stop_codon:yes gene_type:complete